MNSICHNFPSEAHHWAMQTVTGFEISMKLVSCHLFSSCIVGNLWVCRSYPFTFTVFIIIYRKRVAVFSYIFQRCTLFTTISILGIPLDYTKLWLGSKLV